MSQLTVSSQTGYNLQKVTMTNRRNTVVTSKTHLKFCTYGFFDLPVSFDPTPFWFLCLISDLSLTSCPTHTNFKHHPPLSNHDFTSV